jgi:hypothetical protein
MGTVSTRKRLETIEHDVLSSMFVGVLSKDDAWLEHTLNETLPALEERALRLAGECRENGECAGDDTLCDEARIRDLFAKTREKLLKEHVTRESKTQFHHG